ncbi:MAG: VWA domain-containing protein [Candidatus Korobacteraceae bacterium]|jgi:VWFA-related protein
MKTKCRAAVVTLLVLVLAGLGMAAQQSTTPAPAAQPPSATSSSASTPQSSPPSPPATPQTTNANVPEMSSREETSTTFKVKVNLVEVRAVVRDLQGNVVGNLRKEDFQLTDNGKPQVITKFSMDQAGAKPVAKHTNAGTDLDDAAPGLPLRYVIFLFDDIHLKFGDLAQVRNAVKRNLLTLQSTDRVAIFTTSGQTQLDFTDDRAKLQDALDHLQPRPITGAGAQECPDVTYYVADQVQNKNDPQALRLITQDTLDCAFDGDPRQEAAAQQMAQSAIMRELDLGNHETQVALDTLKSAVQRMAATPGQRSIILVSPGFYNPDQLQEQMEIADRALHSGVIISALDARGLYTLTPNASNGRVPSPSIAGQMMQYTHQEASAYADVMAGLADATGGTFIQNTNDLEGGLRRLATPPEYSYLLAFSPQDLKLDGRFHNLKVTVKGQKLNIQARKGYYAPRQATSAAEQAKQQIRDEVFSQEELHDLPVELHTQFFKTSDNDAKLSVLVKLDVQHLHYRKVDGRNNNSVTVTAVLFDRNGNFVSGDQKTLEMHWKDETLGAKLAAGVTLKSSFDVKPGSYMVRLVVRDEEGQLTAQNGAIEIP